ncbi:MAG TPA: hypothetical protein VM012_02510 [Flavitalea sp.]|nr:hypothetical protein [Flavitalea sp.]
MKSTILPLAIAALALGSCTTTYRAGQTPDDVYYSPAREKDAYVQVENNRDNYRTESYRDYDDAYVPSDDRWLRMRVRNRSRWSAFDEYDWNDYRYNSYNLYSPYNHSFNNYFNSYWMWNNNYNPYCPRTIIVNPKTNPVVYNKVRNFSLNSYTNTNYNTTRTTNMKSVNRGIIRPGYDNSTSTTTQSSNTNSLGNSIRKVFNSGSRNNDTYTTPSSDRPARTYTPSTSNNNNSSNNSSRSSSNSSSSGSSSSGSSGGVSRPSRGGN